MPKINQQLLDRLEAKLQVSRARVYDRIASIAGKMMLDRPLAALVLAAENGINIQKYSTNEERAQIRGSLSRNGSGVDAPPTPITTEAPQRRNARLPARKPNKRGKAKDNTVFVVHGRNDQLRVGLFQYLRALGLQPLEWEKVLLLTKKTDPYIGDILDIAMEKVQAVVELFSPDDEARLSTKLLTRSDGASERNLRGQPRPNVLFEAGLALGRHPDKTIIVEVGKLRNFSDIAGRHVVRLTNHFVKRNALANRLELLGCKIDRKGTDWTTVGDFTA